MSVAIPTRAPGARPGAQQVGRFAAVGVLNTLLDYVLFLTLTKLFRMPLEQVWIAKLLSGATAMVSSFYLNRTWVFRGAGEPLRQAAKFVVTTVTGVFVVQTSLTQLFSSVYPQLGILLHHVLTRTGATAAMPNALTPATTIKTVAFAMATAVSMTFNFLVYRFWVFPSREDRQEGG